MSVVLWDQFLPNNDLSWQTRSLIHKNEFILILKINKKFKIVGFYLNGLNGFESTTYFLFIYFLHNYYSF